MTTSTIYNIKEATNEKCNKILTLDIVMFCADLYDSHVTDSFNNEYRYIDRDDNDHYKI